MGLLKQHGRFFCSLLGVELLVGLVDIVRFSSPRRAPLSWRRGMVGGALIAVDT